MKRTLRKDLSELLETLDAETRDRWERTLLEIDSEVNERGPAVIREHLEKALQHLLAVGWGLHRCYAFDEASSPMGPLGDAASTVEDLRTALDELPKKPEWSQ